MTRMISKPNHDLFVDIWKCTFNFLCFVTQLDDTFSFLFYFNKGCAHRVPDHTSTWQIKLI